MRMIDLNGSWQLLDTPLANLGGAEPRPATPEWDAVLEALVSGEVHLDLLRHGRIEEPLFDRNAPKCAWMEKGLTLEDGGVAVWIAYRKVKPAGNGPVTEGARMHRRREA